MSPWTESHRELEILFNLNQDKRDNRAKVEFTPKSMDEAYKPETYTLIIDECRTPEWFDDDMKESVSEKMRHYIKSIVVTGDVQILIGGQFIIAPGAKVECAKCMVISAVWGGTISKILKCFDGILKKVSKPGKVEIDERE